MTPDELNEDPAPDFEEYDWVTPEVTDAINALVDALYSAGCSVNGLDLTIPTIPDGADYIVNSDYGVVRLRDSETVRAEKADEFEKRLALKLAELEEAEEQE